MKRLNNKGFTGFELGIIIMVLGTLIAWQGPNLIKSIGTITSGGDKNQQKSAHIERTSEPIFAKNDATGEVIKVGVKTTELVVNETKAEQPPETLWQKFLHLGIMIIPIIALISYFGAWPLVKYWVNKVKATITKKETELQTLQDQQEELTGDAKLIVKSIDEGLAQFNTAIASAKSAIETDNAAIIATANITDPLQRSAALTLAQQALATHQAILTAVNNLKDAFMSAMSRKQDSTTKLLVKTLQND